MKVRLVLLAVVVTGLTSACEVTPTISPSAPAQATAPSTAVVPSLSPSSAPAAARARGLRVVGVEKPVCASEGGCAAFFRIQPIPGTSTSLAPEWRFEGEGPVLRAPIGAPTTLLPGAYRVSAHLNWVSDVIWAGATPAIGDVVSACERSFTIDPAAIDVVVRITFHLNDACAIEIVIDPPT